VAHIPTSSSLEDGIVVIKGTLSIKEEEEAKLIAREIKDISDHSEFNENNYRRPNGKLYKLIGNTLILFITQ